MDANSPPRLAGRSAPLGERARPGGAPQIAQRFHLPRHTGRSTRLKKRARPGGAPRVPHPVQRRLCPSQRPSIRRSAQQERGLLDNRAHVEKLISARLILACDLRHPLLQPGAPTDTQSRQSTDRLVPADGTCIHQVADCADATRQTTRPWSCCSGVPGHARLQVSAPNEHQFLEASSQPRVLTTEQACFAPPGGALRAAPTSPQGGEVKYPACFAPPDLPTRWGGEIPSLSRPTRPPHMVGR
jgi:hypothetical protein